MAQLKTDRLGIVIEDTPHDRGYWARFNGQPRPDGEEAAGWDDCDEELREERRAVRDARKRT